MPAPIWEHDWCALGWCKTFAREARVTDAPVTHADRDAAGTPYELGALRLLSAGEVAERYVWLCRLEEPRSSLVFTPAQARSLAGELVRRADYVERAVREGEPA
jgi:hypothetical protein